MKWTNRTVSSLAGCLLGVLFPHPGALLSFVARVLVLDAEVEGGEVPLPASDLAAVVLVCPRGSPYSLRALDFLAEACPTAVCVEGGVVAWEEYKLPVGRLGET